MSIPGHAPRPSTPPDPDHRHLAPFHRDDGLARVSRLTKWTVAGGLALTGGLAAVAADAQAGGTHKANAAVAPATSGSTVPGAPASSTVAPTVPPTAAPTAPPVTAAPAQPQTGSSSAAPATAPATVPTTVPPTLPPQPAYTVPEYTPAPPVVVSGGS